MNLHKSLLCLPLLLALCACDSKDIDTAMNNLEGKASAEPVALYGGYSEGSAVISSIVIADFAALSSESSVASSPSVEPVVVVLLPPPSSAACVPVFRVVECD